MFQECWLKGGMSKESVLVWCDFQEMCGRREQQPVRNQVSSIGFTSQARARGSHYCLWGEAEKEGREPLGRQVSRDL